MSKQLTSLSILFTVVVALASCQGGNNTSLSSVNGDSITLKHSSLLTIVAHDGYTIAVIRGRRVNYYIGTISCLAYQRVDINRQTSLMVLSSRFPSNVLPYSPPFIAPYLLNWAWAAVS